MKSERILVTGGAGFIGSNLVHRLLSDGHDLTVFDNLSRPGCEHNISWLQHHDGAASLRLVVAELSDFDALRRAAEGAERVYHLAGQVAVTTSVRDPRHDFEANALGTFNALEAARLAGRDPIFIYASTNKVYGSMEPAASISDDPGHGATWPAVVETQPLDPCSPYGCSKAAGDQYARDYARIYGLRATVLRQSCVYGWRQFGIEDQGWVAWFILAALKGRPITIYGDGRQVRDMLFIDDLLNAYEAAVRNIATAAGQAYNIGGGPANAMRVWTDFGPLLEEILGRPVSVAYAPSRPGDQRVFVSDIGKAERELRWKPRVSVRDGVARLYEWIRDHLHLFPDAQPETMT